MSVRKRSDHWHYDFSVRGVRYRAAIPEARTKAQALRAEADARESVFEGRYGSGGGPSVGFAAFVEEHYIPWVRGNRKSAKDFVLPTNPLAAFFKNKPFTDLSPILIERYKRKRQAGTTRLRRPRAPRTINHELNCLSRICEMAIDAGLLTANPCRRVKKFQIDNPFHPGRRLTEFKRAWEEACRAAEISGLRFHDLRHTTPTRLSEAGVDPFTIREIMGHSDLKMTQRYTHAGDERKRAAMERLVVSAPLQFHSATAPK